MISGQVLVRPDKDPKAAAVHEAETGEIQHEYRRARLQGSADGVLQEILVAQVKFAQEPQHGLPSVMFGDDEQVASGNHGSRFHDGGTRDRIAV
jgi:hypothetical protein